MAVHFWLCFSTFGLVLLAALSQLIWPSFPVFALSLFFSLIHLTLALGMISKLSRMRKRGNAKPFAYNLALSFLSVSIALLGLLPKEHGESQFEPFSNPLEMEASPLIGSDEGEPETEIVPGGNGTSDGFDELGSSQESGDIMGKGREERGPVQLEESIESEKPEQITGEGEEEEIPIETPPSEKSSEEPKEPKREEEEEVFVNLRPRPFGLIPELTAPVRETPTKQALRKPPGGGPAAYGSIASVSASGVVVKPDRDTSILVFFDASGSMEGAYPPLQVMRDTLLLKALLPCYGTVQQYHEKVKVISRKKERYFDWLKEGFEHQKSIVFIFQDESDHHYYTATNLYSSLFMMDIWNLRQSINSFDGSYYRGVLFQVRNRKEEASFQVFLKKTFRVPAFRRSTFDELANFADGNPEARHFIETTPDAGSVPIHVSDYFRRSGPISFDVKTGLPEKASPEYYLHRITEAARELGIDLSGNG